MNRLPFLILVTAALLPLHTVHAFECTRASVQMEINKLRSKFESETQALNDKHARSRPSLGWTSQLPAVGGLADLNRKLAAKRGEREAQERANLRASQEREARNLKQLVIAKCK